MYQILRRDVALPALQSRAVAGAATVLSFAWLLATDQVPPLFVYFLELYLAF